MKHKIPQLNIIVVNEDSVEFEFTTENRLEMDAQIKSVDDSLYLDIYAPKQSLDVLLEWKSTISEKKGSCMFTFDIKEFIIVNEKIDFNVPFQVKSLSFELLTKNGLFRAIEAGRNIDLPIEIATITLENI